MRIVKKLFPLLLGFFIVSLAACGGGKGGGGGSSASSGPCGANTGAECFAGSIRVKANTSTQALGSGVGGNSLSHINSNGTPYGTPNDYDSPEDDINGALTGDGTKLLFGLTPDNKNFVVQQTLPLPGQPTETYLVPFDGGFFNIHQNGLVTQWGGLKDKGMFAGQEAGKIDIAVFGGNFRTGGGLEYTNYGYWTVYYPTNGGRLETYPNGAPAAARFYLVADQNTAAKKAPTPNQTYTGGAVGLAFDHTNPSDRKWAPLVGTASLEVKNSANAADLKLVFDNFYTLTASNLAINGTGGFSKGNNAFAISGGPGNTGINLKNINPTDNKVSGQFFGGTSASNGSEGVGLFDYATNLKGMGGSFGVKQPQP